MGGKIKLDSKLGLGTTVTFHVPAMIEEEASYNVSQAQPQPAARQRDAEGPLKVLLVEDIPMNVEIASAMLHRLSCAVTVSENGKDAIRKATENSFDLILLDIQMPDIDGITVAKHIRKAGITTPIVALTAHVMAHEIAEFKASGMNGHLSKPVIFDQLKSEIERWTG
jgi:CheY-like chemotaxis protein